MRFVGYFPKQIRRPPDWSGPPDVRELCSVSNCIAAPPDGWIDRWLHNSLGFCDTPDLAAALVPPGDPTFTILAFFLLEQCFTRDGTGPFDLQLPAATLPHASWKRLGFDITSRSVADFFECSPLSCNGLAGEHRVNQYCLMETLDAARETAAKFARDEPEPGPYYLFEVWRH